MARCPECKREAKAGDGHKVIVLGPDSDYPIRMLTCPSVPLGEIRAVRPSAGAQSNDADGSETDG